MPSIALNAKPITELRGVTCHMGSHSVTTATRHKWTRPALTPVNQAGTRLTYPGGMEGWVDLGSLIAAGPGIEPTITWSQVQCPNRYATESPILPKKHKHESTAATSPLFCDLAKETLPLMSLLQWHFERCHVYTKSAPNAWVSEQEMLSVRYYSFAVSFE